MLQDEFHPHAMKPLPAMFPHLLSVWFSVTVCVSVDNSIHKFTTTELCVYMHLFYAKENMLLVFRHTELKRTWIIKYLARQRMSVEFFFTYRCTHWNDVYIYTHYALIAVDVALACSLNKLRDRYHRAYLPPFNILVSNRYKHELYLN